MIYGDWIGRWGRARPHSEAMVDAITGTRYTYAELATEINRMAHLLAGRLGVQKGDRVSCLSFNRAEYIFLFLALSRLGAVMVPLNFRLAQGEFLYFFEDSKPKALFYDADHAETVAGFRDRSGIESFVCFDRGDHPGESLPELWDDLSPQDPPQVEIGPDDPQLVIYTSGTTGQPKGALLTHVMLSSNALNTVLGWDMRAADRTILHSAMFYTAGWNVFTLPVFQTGGCNVLVRSFDPDLILELIAKEAITTFFGVPTMFQMLLDSPGFEETDFSTVRFLVSGGAPLPRELMEIYLEKKKIRIWEGYGLTEVGPNCFMANGKLGTVGHPMPMVDLILMDDDGNPVPAEEKGEIWMRGPHVCNGYLNKPKATAEAITQEGWFKTGDLGRLDADGHLSIVGRKKDMIISGGINIYPAEIEAAVGAHPAVAGAAVIGVPDPKWGEVGKAVVELNPGGSLTFEELSEFLRDRLGKYKLPKYLAVVEELPRTPASGKIQKFILKKKHGGPDHE